MELSYRKNDNSTLFSTLGSFSHLHFDNVQNYVPMYDKYFALTDSNHNSINLNHKYTITKIVSSESQNKCTALVVDEEGKVSEKNVFFKLSPLLDPIKYLVGKYDVTDPDLFHLPGRGISRVNAKILDPNNAAYVDSFATYLTSQLLHRHGFVHGLDFYGSFLATKQDFIINLNDDIDYLYDSNFFHKNQGSLFTLNSEFQEELMNYDTRNMKKRLCVEKEDISPAALRLSDVGDLSELDDLFVTNGTTQLSDNLELMFQQNVDVEETEKGGSSARASRDTSSSSCSSRSSHTGDAHSDSGSVTGSDCSTATEDAITATIPRFPVQAIALERCEQTLDFLLVHDSLNDRELSSMVAQVLLTLATLQKTFSLTHNDLHTNNIMWIRTDKKNLCYKLGGTYYKVPTYGRIYKLIDFGRAIYKFKGKTVCSDSFHPKGDAATQYNCEPYFNENKPRLEPNLSFDLCRLGCSIYDFLVEDVSDEMKDLSEIEKIIVRWCHDDKGRNVMYKTNGQERYPEFKLYKMIARTVHEHTPKAVLANRHFSKYIVSRKLANKAGAIMDIDSYPSYVD